MKSGPLLEYKTIIKLIIRGRQLWCATGLLQYVCIKPKACNKYLLHIHIRIIINNIMWTYIHFDRLGIGLGWEGNYHVLGLLDSYTDYEVSIYLNYSLVKAWPFYRGRESWATISQDTLLFPIILNLFIGFLSNLSLSGKNLCHFLVNITSIIRMVWYGTVRVKHMEWSKL